MAKYRTYMGRTADVQATIAEARYLGLTVEHDDDAGTLKITDGPTMVYWALQKSDVNATPIDAWIIRYNTEYFAGEGDEVERIEPETPEHLEGIVERAKEIKRVDTTNEIRADWLTEKYGGGKTEIWYQNAHNEWHKKYGFDWDYDKWEKDALNSIKLGETHILLGTVPFTDLEEIFAKMQGEAWSPLGQARTMIRGKGLSHTSMSIGDIVKLPDGSLHIVAGEGFKQIVLECKTSTTVESKCAVAATPEKPRMPLDELTHYLAGFTGTENWNRNPLYKSLLYTDGIKAMAEKAEAYWLIDEMGVMIGRLPRDELYNFQLWRLDVHDDKTAELSTREDKDKMAYFKKKIEYTDFPGPGVFEWYVIYDWTFKKYVALLKGEY